MIDKEKFFEFIDKLKDQRQRLDALDELGIPLWGTELIEFGNVMFAEIIMAYFSKEGADWIFWWLYEKDGSPELKAWDEEGNEIPTETKEDLWELVKDYRKQWNFQNTQTSQYTKE